MEVITIITANESKYESICKQVTDNNYRYKDLLQDFYEYVLLNVNQFKQALEDGRLDVYCYWTIANMWRHRGRVKTHVDGKTSDLYSISDNVGDWEDYKYYLKNQNARQVTRQAVNELNKLLYSKDKKERFQAGILRDALKHESARNTTKRTVNIRQVSIDKDINYRTAYEAIKETTQKIKTKINET